VLDETRTEIYKEARVIRKLQKGNEFEELCASRGKASRNSSPIPIWEDPATL
jgi:hypothetical protein